MLRSELHYWECNGKWVKKKKKGGKDEGWQLKMLSRKEARIEWSRGAYSEHRIWTCRKTEDHERMNFTFPLSVSCNFRIFIYARASSSLLVPLSRPSAAVNSARIILSHCKPVWYHMQTVLCCRSDSSDHINILIPLCLKDTWAYSHRLILHDISVKREYRL